MVLKKGFVLICKKDNITSSVHSFSEAEVRQVLTFFEAFLEERKKQRKRGKESEKEEREVERKEEEKIKRGGNLNHCCYFFGKLWDNRGQQKVCSFHNVPN